MKRRVFLRYTTLAAAPLLISSSFLSGAEMNIPKRKLVMIHLKGGNDGFNTIVPYTNKDYYDLRPTLAIPADELIKLNENFGFNPSLKSLKPHFDKGHMLIINNVSCDNLDYSHFSAERLWETALTTNNAVTWVERYSQHHNSFGSDNQLLNENIDLTQGEFTASLKDLAVKINHDHSSNQIYRVSLDGFDTHQFQKHKHNLLLQHYADGINCFLNDLEATGALQHTLIVTWSEFGRQLKENTKKGTEHGSSNPLLIYGGGLKAKGIWNNVSHQNPTVDFRNVYATVIDRWLKTPSAAILNGKFETMNWV